MLKASKKKTKKSKQNERTSQDVAQTMNGNLVAPGTEQPGSELLQLASSSKPEENVDLSAKPKKKSKSKQTFSAIDAITPEIHVTEQVASDRLRKNEKMDPADKVYNEELNGILASPVSANVAEEMNVDKPKASKKTKKSKHNEITSEGTSPVSANVAEEMNVDKPKASKKTKKSKHNEITSKAVTQLVNDDLLAAGIGHIDSELLQPAKSSNPEENIVQSQVYRDLSNDIPESLVPANVAEEANVDKPKTSKKTKKSKQNEITSEAVTQLVNDNLVAIGQIDSERLQPAKSSKAEENTVESQVYHEVSNDNPASLVSANLAEETNADKLKASKKKTKKSEQDEITSEALTQLVNDIIVSASTGPIDSELLQPARNNKPEENIDNNSVKPKKKSKSKQTSSAVEAPEIPLTEQVGDGLLTNSRIVTSDHRHLNDISALKACSHEADTRNLDKQTTTKTKSKRKKLDQPSSLDTSSSLMPSKKDCESEKIKALPYEKSQDGSTTPEADIRNLGKQTTSKSKLEKLSQPSSVDTSLSFMISKGDESEKIPLVDHQYPSDVHEAEQMRTIGTDSLQSPHIDNPELNGDSTGDSPKKRPQKKRSDSENNLSQKPAGDSVLANSNVADIEHANLNDNSVLKMSAHEADMRNLENQTTRKLKRKKHNQSSSVDTSSSLMTSKKGYESEKISLVGHQLPTADPEVIEDVTSGKRKKRTHKKHSASEKSLRDLSMKQQPAIEAKVVEQAAAGDDDQNQEKFSLHEMQPGGSTEVRKLDNQPESTLKAGKLDLSSSVDATSNEHNLIASKKSKKRERSRQVSGELQNDVQESELLSQSHAIPTIQVKKVMQKKPTVSVGGLSEEERPDGLLINDNGKVAEHEKGLSPPVRHDNDPNEILSQDVSPTEKMKPEKPPASKQKNVDQSTSVDTESRKENTTVSNKKSGSRNNSLDGSTNILTKAKKVTGTKPHVGENNSVTKSGIPLPNMNHKNRSSVKLSFISESAAKRNSPEYVFKTPSNKNVGKPAKKLPPISGGLFADVSSDSSDNEVERNGLSYSTRIPDDSSSSDYSEGESRGDVVTSQGGGRATKKTNIEVPDLKDMDLPSILRSSSLYKKTRASQSQKEDDDSEPPDFVPESRFSS